MNGWSVWSGGAAGIDSAAHQGALDVNGTSVVVMGTGFEHPYPAQNRTLFERVLDSDGAWLSLYPPEQVAARWTFLPRNELLAAMVQHIVLVQAPLRSGARSTMAAGRRMEKHLWAVPAAPWHSAGAGCLQEIRAGATMLLSADQLLRNPATSPSQRGTKGSKPRESKHFSDISTICTLDETQRALVNILRRQSVNLDVLCDKSGLSASQVSRAMLTLTLQGVVVENIDGSFVLL